MRVDGASVNLGTLTDPNRQNPIHGLWRLLHPNRDTGAGRVPGA